MTIKSFVPLLSLFFILNLKKTINFNYVSNESISDI